MGLMLVLGKIHFLSVSGLFIGLIFCILAIILPNPWGTDYTPLQKKRHAWFRGSCAPKMGPAARWGIRYYQLDHCCFYFCLCFYIQPFLSIPGAREPLNQVLRFFWGRVYFNGFYLLLSYEQCSEWKFKDVQRSWFDAQCYNMGPEVHAINHLARRMLLHN